MSSFKKIALKNLLTLVIWKCVYDRMVYIVKMVSKKGFLRGGTTNLLVAVRAKCAPTQMLSYAPGFNYT